MRPAHRMLAPALALILALAAGSALAATAQYPTAFTKFKYELKGGQATFKGKITSSKGACVQGRKVKLYRQHSGETDKLGGDHTNGNGKFVIDLGSGPPKKGKYYAKVKKATVGGSSNKATCLARTSGSVKLS